MVWQLPILGQAGRLKEGECPYSLRVWRFPGELANLELAKTDEFGAHYAVGLSPSNGARRQILGFFIRAWRVARFIPSRAAAPRAPRITPGSREWWKRCILF